LRNEGMAGWDGDIWSTESEFLILRDAEGTRHSLLHSEAHVTHVDVGATTSR
jgi:hypothetical protein